ncbi:uncharacterized protein [Littorina saxatilis]|uniref:uncharacterized protein n=1 Tax=Littorina saxatilis TaxID=31220 RepID=UPI0038B623D5
MWFDTVRFTVAPSSERLAAFIQKRDLLLSLPRATHRQLLELLGMMESFSNLLPLGRLFKRPLQREIRKQTKKPPLYEEVISLGQWFHISLSQWLNHSWLHSSVTIQTPPSVMSLFTDASKTGWGAHVSPNGQEFAGTWSRAESKLHINLLEMEAVLRTLQCLAPSLTGTSITIHGDNQTCLSYLKKQGGTVSLSLSLKAEEILLWCWKRQITLSVRFVPGKLNAIADQLSRGKQVLPTEWTIVHQALHKVWCRWLKPLLDLFATKYTTRLPMYVSPVHDDQAFKVDALAIPWEGLQAYAYPPTSLLPQVLAKYRQERPTLILVTPFWPTSAWFPELKSLSCEDPLPLALSEGQLVQPRSGIAHTRVNILKLTAWKLCGQDCTHKA